jgi:flagellar biosynthetic protein FliO
MAAMLALSCGAGRGEEPATNSGVAPAQTEAIATNQGVSLPQEEIAVVKSSDTAADRSMVEAENPAGQDSAPQQKPSSTAAAQASRSVKRPSTIGLGQDAATREPWYRTGLGALAIVLAVIGGVAWLVRKWVPSARAAESAVLQTVARTTLSPKHSAALLRMGRRFILVGVSPDGVSVLSEVRDHDEASELSARLGVDGRKSEAAFEQLLGKETGTYDDVADDLAGDDGSPDQGRASVPLGDLLARVKNLQSRWTARSR